MGMTSTKKASQVDSLPRNGKSPTTDGRCAAGGEWIRTTIGAVADLLTGFPFSSSGYAESGVLLVRGSNVKRGMLDWNPEITQHWPRIPPDLSRYELMQGDVVVAMDGALVGRSFAQIGPHDVPSLLLQRVARLRGHDVNQRLLLHWISSDAFVRHVDSVKTHTAIPHISPHDIRSMPLDLAIDGNEQEAIAAALSDVDGLIASLDRLIAKKRAIKQAAMQQLLTGKTRLPGFKGKWSKQRLGAVARITMGRTPSRGISRLWGPGHRWLAISDLQGRIVSDTAEQITDAGAEGIEVIPAGTLVMSFKLSIGRVAFTGADMYSNEAICALRSLQVDPVFMYYALQRVDFSLYGKQAVKGYTLNKQSLKTVEVYAPIDPAEQLAIGRVLRDTDEDVEAAERRREKTIAIKQGMMQALLTGRVRLLVEPAVGGRA